VPELHEVLVGSYRHVLVQHSPPPLHCAPLASVQLDWSQQAEVSSHSSEPS
jgi:hypothetical protein